MARIETLRYTRKAERLLVPPRIKENESSKRERSETVKGFIVSRVSARRGYYLNYRWSIPDTPNDAQKKKKRERLRISGQLAFGNGCYLTYL